MNEIRAAARPSAEKVKNRKYLLPCLAFAAAVRFYLFIHQYTERFRLSLWDETQGYLSEIAQQVTLIINDRMERNLKNLETEALDISRMQPGKKAEVAAFLQTEATRYGYSGLSLAGRDGLALTNGGTVSNVSDRKHYLEALEGTSAISGLLTSDFDNTDAIEFAVPVWKNEKVAAVLLANYSLEDFRDILSVSIFDGRGTCWSSIPSASAFWAATAWTRIIS